MSTTRYAFNQGYMDGLTDAYRGELTDREICERYPEISANDREAYHQGRMDSLMGDSWRYSPIDARKWKA